MALGGFMGAGKSTIGALLAERIGLPFVDTDAVLTERFGPIADQVRSAGEAALRARELALLKELDDGEPRVLATGGGVFADPGHRRMLRRHHVLVSLQAPLDLLRQRVGQGVGRPLWGDDVHALFEARKGAYLDVDRVVDAAAPPREVVDEIAHYLRVSGEVHVAVPLHRYPVAVRPDLRGFGAAVKRTTRARRAVVVTDDQVGPRWGDEVVHELVEAQIEVDEPVVLPSGEEHKDLSTWSRCVEELLARRVTRDVPVIALGGGVLGDIAGFAAATTLRGLSFVQVPTTLLAMVDSAVGGKVGVDHGLGKNLIGAFHQPALVWAALSTLSTLPDRERRAGLAEVVKAAIIADAELFATLEGSGASVVMRPEPLSDLILRAVAIKAEIVAQDEREGGIRAVLNLGHTVAHGLERATSYRAFRHGEAVAIGLVTEARCSELKGLTTLGTADRIARVLGALGLPVAWPDVQIHDVIEALSLDKKRDGDMLVWPVVGDVADCRLVRLSLPEFSELLLEVV